MKNKKSSKPFSQVFSNNSRPKKDMKGWLWLLSQISLALLIMFIMINIILEARTKDVIEEQGKRLKECAEMYKKYKETPEGKLIQELNQSKIENQREKLRRAIDSVEGEDKVSLGFSIFSREEGEEKAIIGLVKEIFDINSGQNGGVNKYFIQACNFANDNLTNQNRMAKGWLPRILSRAKMYFPGEQVKPDFEEIYVENIFWLGGPTGKDGEISKRIINLYTNINDLQGKIISRCEILLSDEYGSTDEKNKKFNKKLNSTELGRLMAEYTKFIIKNPFGKESEKHEFERKIEPAIKRYIKSALASKNIRFLSDY